MLVRHCSCAIRSASSSVSAHERCTWTATGLPSPPCSRKAASIRCRCSRGWLIVISPSAHSPANAAVSTDTAVASSGGGSAGRVQSLARSTVTSPSWSTTSPANSAPDDVDALAQPGVADGLARPRLARDVLVGELARAERDLQPAREQLRERGGRLGDDRRVVALARGVHDAERHRGRLHRGAEPRPREARLALALAPRGEVVGGPRPLEAGGLRVAHRREQRARRRSARATRGSRSRARSVRTPAARWPIRRARRGAARARPRPRTAAGVPRRSRTRPRPRSSGPRSGRARPPAPR